jgi:ferredoxin
MIIGICGLIGSGKGTVADVLVDQGFTKVSFADKLKDGVSTIFGWNRAMLEGDTDESRQWREQRLNELDDPFSVFRCRGIMNCVAVCPKGLNPTKAIGHIRDMLVSRAV